MTRLEEIRERWQADAANILPSDLGNLFVEIDRLQKVIKDRLGDCVGCFDAPDEFCPMHGRPYTDMVEARESVARYHGERADEFDTKVRAAEALAEKWETAPRAYANHGSCLAAAWRTAAQELRSALKGEDEEGNSNG